MLPGPSTRRYDRVHRHLILVSLVVLIALLLVTRLRHVPHRPVVRGHSCVPRVILVECSSSVTPLALWESVILQHPSVAPQLPRRLVTSVWNPRQSISPRLNRRLRSRSRVARQLSRSSLPVSRRRVPLLATSFVSLPYARNMSALLVVKGPAKLVVEGQRRQN